MIPIILAAGSGRRMRPLSEALHKALLPIAGRPVLAWLLDALIAEGLTEVALVVGYRADEIREFVNSHYPTLKVRWVRNDRYEATNNIRSLELGLTATAGEDVLVFEADIVLHPEITARLVRHPAENVALVAPYGPGMDGTVVEIADGSIRRIVPPHEQAADFDFRGTYKTVNAYKFSAAFCRETFLPFLREHAQADGQCYYEVALGALIYLRRARIHAEIVAAEADGTPARWAEIDDPIDLDVAEFRLHPAGRAKLLESSRGGYWKYPLLDFHYLRNIRFPPADLLDEMRERLPDLIGQYGSTQRELERKLAYLLECPPEQLTALHGAAQVFPWLARRFRGGRVLIPEPTFGEFARAFPQAETYADDGGIARERLVRRLRTESFEWVCFVNPNNPTGTVLPTAWISRLVHEFPRTKFLVDESFLDFCDEPTLRGNPAENLLVIGSLSKNWGVPGLRLGWAYTANEDLSAELRREVPIWNLNSPAEFFLESLFKYRGALRESFEHTKRDRRHLAKCLAEVSAVRQVTVGGGNFVTAKLDPHALPNGCTTSKELAARLLEDDRIYVKDLGSRISSQFITLRLAVRLPEEHERLAAALGRLCGGSRLRRAA